MISALSWIKKGAAQEIPDKFKLTDDEYLEISQTIGMHLKDAKDQDPKAMQVDDILPELAEYNLEDYDNEPEEVDADNSNVLFGNIKGLSYYSSNEEDPYVQMKDELDEEEELEEMRILPSDSILVTANTEDDVSHLEIYVYEEEEENLYVHHDIMLPSFPLCIEWLDYRIGKKSSMTTPGNYIAVGTFDPQIEIWDLDSLDVMIPDVILGPSPKQRLSTDSVHPDYHTDAVICLSWNPFARSLLASGSADTSIKLWDLGKPQKAIRSFQMHKDKVAALAWNPTSSSVLLSGGFDKKICVFDTRSPDKTCNFKLSSDVECLKWDPFSPERFMVSTEDGIVQCFDARNSKECLFKIHAHDGAVSALDISAVLPGCMITGSSDKTVKVWNINGNKPSCISSRDLGTGKVFSANFAKDSPYLVALGGSKGKMIIWNLENNAGVRKAFPSKNAGNAKKGNGAEILQLEMDDEIEVPEDEYEDVNDEDTLVSLHVMFNENTIKYSNQACDICYKRKLKCDKLIPSCSLCLEKRHACTYYRQISQRGPEKGYIQQLVTKKLFLQKQVDKLRVIVKSSTTDLDSITHGNEEEPDLEFLDLFFHYLYPYAPIFNKPVFYSHLKTQDKALLYSMYALALLYHNSNLMENPDLGLADYYFNQARILSNKCFSTPSLVSVQLSFVLKTYCLCRGFEKTHLIYQGLLMQFAFLLNLNEESKDSNHDPIDNELRKRLWWACFISDKQVNTVHAERPSSYIIEEGYTVSLPSSEEKFNHPMPKNLQSLNSDKHISYSCVIVMTNILGIAVNFDSEEIVSPSDHKSKFDKLNIAMRDAFLSLPDDIKIYPRALQSDWMTPYIHFIFHAALIILNRSFINIYYKSDPVSYQNHPQVISSISSARAITEISKLISESNPAFLFIDPFSGFCRYLAGVVFVSVIKSNVEGEHLQHSKAGIEIILRSLLGQGRFCKCAHNFYQRLQMDISQMKIMNQRRIQVMDE